MAIETSKAKASDEVQIREMIDNWVKAVRAKDVDKAMSDYAPDLLSFNFLPPLQHVGLDSAKKRAAEWFASWQGLFDYELRDLKLTVGDTAAFCHCLNHVKGTKTNGEKVDMWWRATVCFRKTDGKWLVTHEHISVPFDMNSGKALLDLKP